VQQVTVNRIRAEGLRLSVGLKRWIGENSLWTSDEVVGLVLLLAIISLIIMKEVSHSVWTSLGVDYPPDHHLTVW
jgi:hypothetical protein